MACGKFWEEKDEWLMPPFSILLQFLAASVSEAHSCRRPLQNTVYFGVVHRGRDLNLNILTSRMGQTCCTEPVHFLPPGLCLIPSGHIVCNASGVTKGPRNKLYKFDSCDYPELSLVAGTWCSVALLENCSWFVICLGQRWNASGKQ